MSAVERILEDLASGNAETSEDAARKEERLARRFYRNGAEKRIRAAHAATNRIETTHIARVARLLGTPRGAEIDKDDPAVVEREWAALPKPPKRGLPKVTLTVVLAIGIAPFLAFFLHLALRPYDPTRAGVGRALSQNVGTYVGDVTRGGRSGPEGAMRKVFPIERPALGDAGTLAFERFFGEYEAAADDSKNMGKLYVETRNVNRALQNRGLPFFLDTKLWMPKQPIIYAYYIEKEAHASAPGFQSERIVFLWRLDRLNITKAALGYTHREADAALVLYDQIESFLIRDVLPALAEGEKVELIDEQSRDAKRAWQDDIETRSARMVRESFASAADRETLSVLGDLLAKRKKIVAKWKLELAQQRIILHPPDRLIPEADYVKDLWLLVSAASRSEWTDIHDKLQSKAILRTFEAVRDRFARDVARHELQHRLDAQRTKECTLEQACDAIKIPALIGKRTGFHDGDKAYFNTSAVRVWDETSAYLAEMTAPESMPKMTILSLLRMVLDRNEWGDTYCTTSIALLEALSDEFGLSDPQYPLVQGGYIQRSAVSSLAVLLFSKSDADLRDAAAKAWRKLYGADIAQPAIAIGKENKRWRH